MKRILLIVGLMVAVGGAVGLYLYNKPHQNIAKAKSDYQMEAPQLFAAFEADEIAANEQYLDKIVTVNGVIQSVSKDDAGLIQLTLEAGGLMGGVICNLDPAHYEATTAFEEGKTISLKGICTGMLMDVVLVRCVMV